MTSNVDITKPETGSATTASVRGNFSTIKNELESIHAAWGYANYYDTATASSPISVLALSGFTKLTNNTLGALTTVSPIPLGVTKLWDAPTNRLYFNDLPLNSMVDIVTELEVTMTEPDVTFDCDIFVGIGTVDARQFKCIGDFRKVSTNVYTCMFWGSLYIQNNNIKNNGAEIKVKSSVDCTVKVSNFFIRALKPVGR